MDVFWPSASPESARNSLNVTLHDLRQAFRALTDTAIVEFVDGAYLLNPSLDVWIDIEAFDNHLQASQQYETTQQREMMIKELESAASLYQGDFLADDLYEDWTVLIRERLHLAYLGCALSAQPLLFRKRTVRRLCCRKSEHFGT